MSLHSAVRPSFTSRYANVPPVSGRSATVNFSLHGTRLNALPKVQLDGIGLSYRTNDGSRLLALDDINLKVAAGEFLCIVGPSGCGKSTLLHLIAGLHTPTAGEVLVDDKPVQGTGTDRILIFQELGLFPWLTVAENVEFGMKMKGMARAERREAVERYLRLVH